MSTVTSMTFPTGSVISHLPQTRIKSSRQHNFSAAVRLIAMKLARGFDTARSRGSEKFLQTHLLGIHLALLAEIAVGPLMGSLTFSLYTRWIM